MKLLASVCGVIVALAIVGTATGQDGEKRTIKRLAWFLIDAKTKGVSEQTETKGTGIKRIEISEGTVAKKVLLEAKDTNGDQISEYLGDLGREWVVKSVKMTLADDTVVEAQILLGKETGKATLQNVKQAGPRVVSDKGTRTWNAFYAENQVATDSSQEDIAQFEKDMEALQGTWRESKMTTVVVKGDRLSQIDFSAGPRDVITGLITIDPKTKAIDWPMETGLGLGHTMFGIYELKGDNLRIIFGDAKDKRPKTSDEKDGWPLVLKREKPTAPPKLPKEPEKPAAEKPLEQQANKKPGALEKEPASVKKPGAIFRVPHSGTSEVALSADGKLLARGAIGGVVDVWEVASGKKLHTLKGHTTSVVKVAFSPDGKTLASAATTWGLYEEGTLIDGKKPGPGELKLWDLVTGKERVTLKGHPGLALSMAFSPDGKTLATESSEETEEKGGLVRFWDVDTGKKKLELKQDNCVQSIAFSPDGTTLAVGTGGFFIEPPVPSSVVLWDVTTGKERARTLPAHTGWISWVGFAPDGKTLASVSCSADKEKPLPAQLKLWDAATAKERASIPLRMIGPIQFFSLAFTADDKTLTSAMWSCDEKKEVGLAVDHWELATGKARATFWAPLPRITYGERDVGKCAFPMAALSADGKTVAWRGAEMEPMNNIGTAHVWEVQSLPTSPPKLPE